MTNTIPKQKIVKYLQSNERTTVIELIKEFKLSRQAIQKHLKDLQEGGYIIKEGSPPKVYYSIKSEVTTNSEQKPKLEYLNDFYYIDSIGNAHTGNKGFEQWCDERKFDFETYAAKYKNIIELYSKYKINGVIDATIKMHDTFKDDLYIDKAFYSDFSAIEIFGKTKLYSQLFYSKQSGKKSNMINLFALIKDQILYLLKEYKIDQIGYVPPTVKREVQLMIELKNYLNIHLPNISISKIKNEFTVPQKSLSKPIERIENAKKSFHVNPGEILKNILLIDDFVGSGSSLNYVAKKIKAKNPKCTIIAYAISGTPNGIINNSKKFEVINEA
jgi:predicted amidophosphoribosyltransferase/DNA-binding transcriptional ArsR family regulator